MVFVDCRKLVVSEACGIFLVVVNELNRSVRLNR